MIMSVSVIVLISVDITIHHINTSLITHGSERMFVHSFIFIG